MSEIQVGQINSTDGSTAITTGADGYVSFAKTQIGGRRNLIINGAMQVAQRGTSFTGLSNGDSGYNLDRFKFAEGGAPTYVVTVSQSSEAPDGFASSLKYDVTTAQASLAASDQMKCEYVTEAQDNQQIAYGSSNPLTMTLSFYVRSNKTGTYAFWIRKDDDSRQQTHNYTINSADTWERKTITIVGDTTGAISNDNTKGFLLSWCLATGTTYTSGTASSTWEANNTANRFVGQTVNLADNTANYWQITGVQLEVGTVATPFEHRSYGEELALCQRYTNRFDNSARIGVGTVGSSTECYVMVHLPVEMRAAPSLTVNALGNVVKEGIAWYANTAISVSGSATQGITLQTTQSNNNMAGQNSTQLGNGCDLLFDAEL